MRLVSGCDILFHDAQYTDEELPARAYFGHSSPGYAVRLAERAGVKRLVLYHHDPQRTDDQIDRILRFIRVPQSRSKLQSAGPSSTWSPNRRGRQAGPGTAPGPSRGATTSPLTQADYLGQPSHPEGDSREEVALGALGMVFAAELRRRWRSWLVMAGAR